MDDLTPRPAALPNIELQRSGYIPSSEQARAIEEYSTQLQSAYERLNAEIARLSARRCEFGRELELNRSLLAPVHTLPQELLSEVFMHAAQDTPGWRQTSLLFALTLCSVCATWRATARGTPLLWRDIDLNLCMAGYAGDPLLRLHMQLSGQRPLCISSTRCEVALVDFLNTLPDLDAARVQELVLSENGYTLSKIQARPLPALSRAVITIRDACAPDAFNVIVKAPSLTNLTITYYADCTDEELGNGLAFPRLNNTSEFACLTRVKLLLLGDLPIWALFPTFATFAPALRELEIGVSSFTDFQDSVPPSHTIYEMPCLRHADLQYHAHAFLAHINAAELGTLRLSNTFHPDSSLAASLLDFLRRSGCPMRSFGLKGPMDETDLEMLIQCFERMEGLRELILEDDHIPFDSVPCMEAVLTRLVCVEDGPPLLPHLSSLSLKLLGTGQPLPTSIVTPLGLMRWSRREPRICAGRAVVALEQFTTNADISADTPSM